MNQQNLEAALRPFARRRPFRPFLIEFVSGDRVLVRHPEAVRFRGGLLVHVSPAFEHRLFDSDSVCQLLDGPQPGAG
jgi:hypothetical protein